MLYSRQFKIGVHLLKVELSQLLTPVVTNREYVRKIITHSSNPRNGQDRCCHKEWIRKKSVLDFSPPDRLVKQTLSLAGLDSFEGHT